MPEVLYIECALETTREKSSERRSERSKRSHDKQMEMIRRIGHVGQMKSDLEKVDHQLQTSVEHDEESHSGFETSIDEYRPSVSLPEEDRVGFTLNIRENIDTEVVCWTNQIIVSHEKCSPLAGSRTSELSVRCTGNCLRTTNANKRVHKNAPTNPSTVFFGLSFIKGVLPKSLPAKSWVLASAQRSFIHRSQLTTDISHNVIANDKRRGYEEPDESFEYIVDYEMTECVHICETVK